MNQVGMASDLNNLFNTLGRAGGAKAGRAASANANRQANTTQLVQQQQQVPFQGFAGMGGNQLGLGAGAGRANGLGLNVMA